MILNTDVLAYKTMHTLSYNTHAILETFFDGFLKVEPNPFDIHTFSLEGIDYTFSQQNATTFDKEHGKDQVPMLIILKGTHATQDEFEKNLSKIVLSIPMWYPDAKMEAEIEGLSEFKYLVLNSNRHFILNPDHVPKYVSIDKEKTLPLIRLFAKSVKDVDLIKCYTDEVDYIHRTFIYNLETISEMMPRFFKNKDLYDDYKDLGNPIVYIKEGNDEIWASSSDSHLHIVLKTEGFYRLWYINKDNHYKWDDDDEPIHAIDLDTDSMYKDPVALIQWLLNDCVPSTFVFNKDCVLCHDVIDDAISSAHRAFVGEIDFIRNRFDVPRATQIIKNANDFTRYDLGFYDLTNLVGWTFLGASSFKWKDGGIAYKTQVSPHRDFSPLAPFDVEDEIKPCGMIASYTNVLIQCIPDDVDSSFLPLLKEAYLMLENKQFKGLFVNDDVDINDFKDRLIELGVDF